MKVIALTAGFVLLAGSALAGQSHDRIRGNHDTVGNNDGNTKTITRTTTTSDSYDTVDLPKLKDLVGAIHGSNDSVTLEIVE